MNEGMKGMIVLLILGYLILRRLLAKRRRELVERTSPCLRELEKINAICRHFVQSAIWEKATGRFSGKII